MSTEGEVMVVTTGLDTTSSGAPARSACWPLIIVGRCDCRDTSLLGMVLGGLGGG
jgi:hypothetical protein